MQSVKDFFEDRENKSAVQVNSKKEAEVLAVVDGSNQVLDAASTTALAESPLSRPSAESSFNRSSSQKRESTNLDSKPSASNLKFITWNIDGLNEENFKARTKAVCKIIDEEQADIVFLQELVPESAEYFLKHLPMYHCTFGNEDGYFVGTLLKKSSVQFIESEIIEYPQTRMMRNLLKVNVKFNDLSLCLLNSHLESTREEAKERKEQLKFVFRRMLSPKKQTVIFAGDMNVRDKEITELGGLPAVVEDLWITCGRPEKCEYTFDMTMNDNRIPIHGKWIPRFRFDRVYVRHSSPTKLKPVFFGFTGLERILPHRCFPSDHWGILCLFEIM